MDDDTSMKSYYLYSLRRRFFSRTALYTAWVTAFCCFTAYTCSYVTLLSFLLPVYSTVHSKATV
jgi:hypothetical protein